MDYPKEFIRGIPNEKDFTEDGYPNASLFGFNKQPNSDGCLEESINWYDDEKALETIFNQTKGDGSIQFKYGALILSKDALDNVISQAKTKFSTYLDYNRDPLPSNSYHGNILIGNTKKKKMLASTIVMMCSNRVEKRIEQELNSTNNSTDKISDKVEVEK